MHLSKSVCALFLSCVILSSSPVSASALLPTHDSQSDSQSNSDDSGYVFTPPDGFQPPPPYQDDVLGSPPTGALNNGNADLLHSVPPPSAPTDDVTLTPPIVPPTDDVTPPIVPPPTSDTPLTPQLPVILPPPPDSSLPLTPQLPYTSPPPDSALPESPQLLPLASPPTLYNTLPGSPHSPLPYHHPGDTQPATSTAPAPFGVNPGGENQGHQFGQANSGLLGQQQSSNDLPFAGQIGGCGSTRADFVGITVAFVGIMLIYWV